MTILTTKFKSAVIGHLKSLEERVTGCGVRVAGEESEDGRRKTDDG